MDDNIDSRCRALADRLRCDLAGCSFLPHTLADLHHPDCDLHPCLSGFTPPSRFLLQKRMQFVRLNAFELTNLIIWAIPQIALCLFFSDDLVACISDCSLDPSACWSPAFYSFPGSGIDLQFLGPIRRNPAFRQMDISQLDGVFLSP